jgi:eukaryotic-like serine/threonine-protein kinase
MGHIFISHVEEDEPTVLEIVRGVESAGFRTWYYKRDCIPGLSYLIQTGQAIEEALAVLLVISPDSLGSHQVTKELVRAHEAGKPFIPVLRGISFVEFQRAQPEWREALGSATSIAIPPGEVVEILPRIIGGLKALDKLAKSKSSRTLEPAETGRNTPRDGVKNGHHIPSASSTRAFLSKSALALAIAVVVVASLVWYARLRRRADNYNIGPLKGRRSVAVLGFKNLSGKPDVGWLATAFSEMLSTELAAGENLRVIPGENIARLKADLRLPDSDSLATDTLSEIHRNLGSDLLVLGSYLDLSGEIRVDLHLQDAAQGQTIASFSETGSEPQLLDLVNRLGADVRTKCGLAGITQSQAAEVKASSPANQQAARQYAEGLAKLRVFDVLAARDLLQQALASDPNFALTHSALAEAWSKLGYGQKAIQEAGKAVDGSTGLSREEQLSIQGQYRAAKQQWSEAAEIYRELFASFPDNIDYGLDWSAAQVSAGKPRDALPTLIALRRLAQPVGDDPRIDLAESSARDALGDYKTELEASRRAAEKGNASGGRFVVAWALRFEGSALRALGETKPAMAVLQQSSHLFSALGDRGGIPLITIGNILAEQGAFDQAKQFFEQALRNAREIGDRATECIALTNIAHVNSDRGDLAAAKPLYVEALGVQREIEDRKNAGSTLSNLGHLLYQIGNYPEAERMLEESLTIAREVGNRRSEAYVLGFTGELRYAEGKLEESKARGEESLALAREIGHKRVVESSLSSIGAVLLAQGDFDSAQKHQEAALAVAKEIGEKGSAAQYRLAMAQVSLEKGLPTEAEALIAEPLAEFQAEKAKSGEALALSLRACALLAQRDVKKAKKAVELANVAAAHTQYYLTAFHVEMAKAAVLSDSGQIAAAGALLHAAMSSAVTTGCVPCEFEVRLARAQMEIKLSKSASALADLEQLEKDATGKGFLLIARKAAAARASRSRTS